VTFTEMAFTGYVFHSRQEIESFVEPQHGCTFHWSRRIALQFNAFVAVGYPENENGTFYNSLCIVNRSGELILNYRKTFLYETDEHWATESHLGFQYVQIESFRMAFGICMDLNPQHFNIHNDTHALASFAKENQVDILVLSAAWLRSHEQSSINSRKHELNQLYQYWYVVYAAFQTLNPFHRM